MKRLLDNKDIITFALLSEGRASIELID